METGIDLIRKEREEQISKHNRTVQRDILVNNKGQLSHAASLLLQKTEGTPFDDGYNGLDECFRKIIPHNWDEVIFKKMYDKTYKQRLIIAGALISAEIDRLQNKKEGI